MSTLIVRDGQFLLTVGQALNNIGVVLGGHTMSTSMSSKIAKLLALAEHPNTSPTEAANAAAMAAELALKYNIDTDSVRQSEIPKQFVKDLSQWHSRSRDIDAVSLMGGWVAKMFGCKLLIHAFKGDAFYSFSGQPHNVALSHSWLHYLWQSCLKANTEFAKGRAYGDARIRQQARDNFRLHFSAAVATRLIQRLDQMRSQGVSGSTALVVQNWFDQEHREVSVWVEQNNDKIVEHKPREIKQLLDAALAGHAAGNRVGLQDQVSGNKKTELLR